MSKEFVVMLARQRSGTNPLRSVLSTHPDLSCTPEVFHDAPSPDAELEMETNFFRFAASHPKSRPDHARSYGEQAEVFRDFLKYLGEFTDKRVVVLDVKYNSTHHLNAAWKFISAEPSMFSFMKAMGVRAFNLTRKNFLRYHLSQRKAMATETWTASHEGDHRDPRVDVDVKLMLRDLDLCERENAIIQRSFGSYGKYLTLDYDDFFPVMGAPVSADALGRLAEWLEIEPTFENEPAYRKQASLTLAETIRNYAEVEEALRGTRFEYCLGDEAMYRSAESSPANAVT